MAIRPVFVSDILQPGLVDVRDTNFEWFSGFSPSQKQKSVESLHQNFISYNPTNRVLEVSTKSTESIGRALSAFNLKIWSSKLCTTFSLESAFQSSKVFERGGPFTDLLGVSAKEAKQDSRLRNSGKLIGFNYFGQAWELEPKTAFYDWLYITTVYRIPFASEEIIKYDSFTDIEFNPQKSINCQARAAALYVSLYKMGMLDEAVNSVEKYLSVINNR